MLNEETMLKVVQNISGNMEISMDTTFAELELDSTGIVEILIELEMLLDKDVLDANLNIDNFLRIKDAYDYVNRL